VIISHFSLFFTKRKFSKNLVKQANFQKQNDQCSLKNTYDFKKKLISFTDTQHYLPSQRRIFAKIHISTN